MDEMLENFRRADSSAYGYEEWHDEVAAALPIEHREKEKESEEGDDRTSRKVGDGKEDLGKARGPAVIETLDDGMVALIDK